MKFRSHRGGVFYTPDDVRSAYMFDPDIIEV